MRTPGTLALSAVLVGCSAAPPPIPSPAPPVSAAPLVTASATAAPSATASVAASAAPAPGKAPAWITLEAPPPAFAPDGKVEEWLSSGEATRGWISLQERRLVVAGAAPEGAASVEVVVDFGPRIGPTPHLLDGLLRHDGACERFSGASLAKCQAALTSQGVAIAELLASTAVTYTLQGKAVTIAGKPAGGAKGAVSSGASPGWFELDVPLAEMPSLARPLVKHFRITVRAPGDDEARPAEIEPRNRVAVGGERAILADATLAAAEAEDHMLFAVFDPTGPEPLLRALELAPTTRLVPDQRAKAVTTAVQATKVESKAREVEVLRYDALGLHGVASRKAGTLVDAFALGAGGRFRQFRVREDVVDVAYDRASPLSGGPAGIEVVLLAVARVDASGAITRVFAGEEVPLAIGSTRTIAADLGRFSVKGRLWTGSGFGPASLVWTYSPGSRTYVETESKLP